MPETTMKNLAGNKVQTQFRKDITADNLQKSLMVLDVKYVTAKRTKTYRVAEELENQFKENC